MRAWALGTAFTAAAAIAAAACGGGGAAQGTSTGGSPPMNDGGPGDAGDGSVPYPAPHPPLPLVISGGTVLKQPKIVGVSFPSDPLEADIDAFSTAIGKTTYWGDMVKEYGIGALTPIGRIHSTFAPPVTFDDTDIQTWLLSQLDGTHPEWPAPDDDTIYALYFPPGVTITYGGTDSCSGFHGYHGSVQLPGSTTQAVYAVISRCDSIPEDPAATGIQYVSAVASHEVIEAITDPYPLTNDLGYFETDDDHLAWTMLSLAELGDMCALIGGAFYTPPDFPYLVQRIWSNAQAKAGHEPCLPQPAGQVYFNTAPVLDDKVSFNAFGQAGATKGVLIPVGQTRTVELDLFSEAPTSGPWSVVVKEVNGSSLDLTLDETKGQNGDKITLTIHVKSKNGYYGAEIFLVESVLGAEKNLWVGMVGN